MRTVYRSPLVALMLLAGILAIITVLQPSKLLGQTRRRRVRAKAMTMWARGMLKTMGINHCVTGHRPGSNVMFVSNHISWIDILVLMASCPGVFLAKSDLLGWPLIGWMCRQADTMFLQRGNARALVERMGSLRHAFGQRENVFLFPEGTTTKGVVVRDFFPGLFQAAIDSGIAVQPVALTYREQGNRSVSVPYVDDDHFVKHFARLLKTHSLSAHVTFLPPINTDRQDRRSLANLSQNLISRVVSGEVEFDSRTAA